MSEYLVAQIARVANMSVLLGTQVQEPLGNQALEAVAVADKQTGAPGVIRALFVFIGVSSCAGWLGDLLDLDDHRFAMSAAARPSGVAAAVGEGAMAIRLAVDRMQSK